MGVERFSYLWRREPQGLFLFQFPAFVYHWARPTCQLNLFCSPSAAYLLILLLKGWEHQPLSRCLFFHSKCATSVSDLVPPTRCFERETRLMFLLTHTLLCSWDCKTKRPSNSFIPCFPPSNISLASSKQTCFLLNFYQFIDFLFLNFSTEATYAYKQNIPIVPLLVEKDYSADGWLGALVGTLLYFKFFEDAQLEQNLPYLVQELGNRAKEGEINW